MLKHRVIPVLLLRNGGFVKTRKFKDAKYLGDAMNIIRIFNEKEVDEVVVLDILASRAGKAPDDRILAALAGECFMPLCYGGGVKTVEQAARILALGVEKISLQTAAIADLRTLAAIAERFGSQSVVVSIDVKRDWRGRPRLLAAARGVCEKRSWVGFLKDAVSAGAGEILLNAVDRDGTMAGPDLALIAEAAAATDVPVIAVGGVGSLADIESAVDAGASAVGAGAFFVFQGPHRAVLITYPSYRELEDLFGRG